MPKTNSVQPSPVPPQFKYVTPAENPTLLAQVATKSLDSQILTLSTRELLAVAPKIQRQLKELVTIKQIPSAFNMVIGDRYEGCEEIDDTCQETENMDVFYEAMRNPSLPANAPEGIISASHMKELKVLEVEIGGYNSLCIVVLGLRSSILIFFFSRSSEAASHVPGSDTSGYFNLKFHPFF